ncbi:MAG: spore maturation protein A [Ruminiclostridium sp.]|jgi:spore maturation protein A|nr:spore maturation protein A [Ruminiclostridium sp.]
MAMTVIWTGMTALSLLCALALGNAGGLASAALDGAAQAIQLGISMAGVLCLWMGIMEVMDRAGLATKLAALLRPVLRRLFPDFSSDRGVMDTIASNVSANLLGLGNAATPLGMEAARRMARRTPGVAGDSLCMLVVCNTASIQLIPTTVAAVRMAAGCETPFDILPAVWITSALSVVTGIAAAKLLSKVWRD